MTTQVGVRAASRIRKSIAVGAVALGAASFAACGGSAETKTGAGPVETASFIPAGSLFYMEESTDLNSAQWQTALDVAKRFPGFDSVVADMRTSMAKDGVEFSRDILPLLGTSAAQGVVTIDPTKLNRPRARTTATGATSTSSDYVPPAVFAIDIADGKDAQVEQLITSPKMGGAVKVGEVDGVTIYKGSDSSAHGSTDAWLTVADGTLVIGSTEDVLKQALAAHKSGANMATSERLQGVLGALPADTIAQGYVDVAGFMEIAKQALPAASLAQLNAAGIGPNAAMGMSLTAEQGGLRIKAIGVDYQSKGTTAFTPTFTANVPANAVLMLGTNNLFEMGRASLEPLMAQDEQVKGQLLQAKGALALFGLSTADLKTLLSGESAFALTPGEAPDKPAVGAVVGTPDGAQSATVLDRLRTSIPQLSNGSVPAFTAVTLANGVSGWQSKTDPKASLVYGVDGNNVFLGSTPDVVRQLQAPKLALADDAAFTAATRQMPAKVASLAWVNGDTLWPMMQALGAFKTAPAEALPNLKRLRNLALWSTQGDQQTLEAFLTIG